MKNLWIIGAVIVGGAIAIIGFMAAKNRQWIPMNHEDQEIPAEE